MTVFVQTKNGEEIAEIVEQSLPIGWCGMECGLGQFDDESEIRFDIITERMGAFVSEYGDNVRFEFKNVDIARSLHGIKTSGSRIFSPSILGMEKWNGVKTRKIEEGKAYAFERNFWSDYEGRLGLAGVYILYGVVQKITKTTIKILIAGYRENDLPIFCDGEYYDEELQYRAIDGKIGELKTIKTWNKAFLLS